MTLVQVFHLEQMHVRAAALTSLSSKEAISEAYKTMETDADLSFVYGAFLSRRSHLEEGSKLEVLVVALCVTSASWQAFTYTDALAKVSGKDSLHRPVLNDNKLLLVTCLSVQQHQNGLSMPSASCQS